MSRTSAFPHFGPTASWELLRRRAELLRRLRAFFDDRGLCEVTTPIWSRDTAVERHLDPVACLLPRGPRADDEGVQGWLQTSPELHMKRLLAAGAEAIYQIAPAFRAGDRGPLHNPEFTIVEWYRVGDDLHAGMDLLADLVVTLLPHRPPVRRRTVREVFLEYARIDPHRADVHELRKVALAHNAALAGCTGFDRQAWLDVLLVELIEPHLGRDMPDILFDYPADQSAQARLRTDTDGTVVAERFELYVDSLELANGYHELLDADQLLQRQRQANVQRRRDGKPELPTDNRLLDAMRSGLPPCAGVALGWDRLVMVALGAKSIDEVLTFPIEIA